CRQCGMQLVGYPLKRARIFNGPRLAPVSSTRLRRPRQGHCADVRRSCEAQLRLLHRIENIWGVMARAGKQKSGRAKSGKKRRVAGKIGGQAARRSVAPAKSTSKSAALDPLIEAGAGALALTIEPAWKLSVRANLEVIFGQAALFADFE